MRAFFVAALLAFSFNSLAENIVFKLNRKENVRILFKEILEIEATLPEGTTLSVPKGLSPETHLFRTTGGKVERSSNGFMPQVQIISSDISEERREALNKLNLWITLAVIPLQTSQNFPALKLKEPKSDYLQNFEESGKPKFNFTKYFKTRFPKGLNRSIASEDQTNEERLKWRTIMKELEAAGDRSKVTKSHYLFIPQSKAQEASIAYENKDEVEPYGAWTIAVKATAVRHGFPNVPCAEFMSEMIRQAYKRAGFDVMKDFNPSEGTHLIWKKTSAVINLTNTLYKVGWIPWELANFRPPTGAIMAHFKATTPGHVYMAAGMDGRLVVDNGSPAGRQLYNTSEKTIKMMYYGGVFFLPPGIHPEAW